MVIISATTIIPSAVIISVVIWTPPPPEKWPWVNIHGRVNRLMYYGGGLSRRFAGSVDQCIYHYVAGSSCFQGDDLVSCQIISGAGVLNLADNDGITDLGLNQRLHFGERGSCRLGRGNRCVSSRGAAGQ